MLRKNLNLFSAFLCIIMLSLITGCGEKSNEQDSNGRNNTTGHSENNSNENGSYTEYEKANTVSIGVLRYDTKMTGLYNDSFQAISQEVWGRHGYWSFYSRVDEEGNLIELSQDAKGVSEQENQYAYDAGIDYWIFNDFPVSWPIARILYNYLDSSNKDLVKFTLFIGSIEPTRLHRSLNHMLDPQWMRVLDDRPLLYIYNSGIFNSAEGIKEIRDYVQNTLQLPNPYIVLFDERGKGEDSSSQYGPGAYINLVGAPYESFIDGVAGSWDSQAENSTNFIPNAPYNWDVRPWRMTPADWMEHLLPGYWSVPPTGEEFRQMLQNGVNWVLNNPDKSPAMTLVTKEWNGQEEGGNIAPSLRYGTEMIDAVKLVNKSSIVPGPIVDHTIRNMMELRVYNGELSNETDKFSYKIFSDKTYTFQSGDYIEYDVKMLDTQSGAGGIDIQLSDGSYFRDYDFYDQNGKPGNVKNSTLVEYASNVWYRRRLPVPAEMIGKTASAWILTGENDEINNAYAVLYNNVLVTDGDRTIRKSIYGISTDSTIQKVDASADTGVRLFFVDEEGSKGDNLVSNPGFKEGMTSWDSVGTNPEAAYTQEGGHSGTMELIHGHTSAYNVSTQQTIGDLDNGLYTLRAWVKSSENLELAHMFVNAGDMVRYHQIYSGVSSYQLITIPDVNVTDGTVKIGFYSVNQSPDQWLAITDIEFFKNSVNLVSNPKFEEGLASWKISGENPEAPYTQSGGHSGNTEAVHGKEDSNYTVDTYQTIMGLANGTYTLKAWVRSDENFGLGYMYAKDFGGSTLKYNIPWNLQYQQLIIPNIEVTNNKCTIGFYSENAPAGTSFAFDDVVFYKNQKS